MLKLDMWYDNKVEEITDITSCWADLDCEYRGNLLIDNRYVGDFTTDNIDSLREIFPQVFEIPFC